MNKHPHYNDAVALLATIHDTLPEIIHQNAHDTETEIGLQIARELRIVLNYTDAISTNAQGRNPETAQPLIVKQPSLPARDAAAFSPLRNS